MTVAAIIAAPMRHSNSSQDARPLAYNVRPHATDASEKLSPHCSRFCGGFVWTTAEDAARSAELRRRAGRPVEQRDRNRRGAQRSDADRGDGDKRRHHDCIHASRHSDDDIDRAAGHDRRLAVHQHPGLDQRLHSAATSSAACTASIHSAANRHRDEHRRTADDDANCSADDRHR